MGVETGTCNLRLDTWDMGLECLKCWTWGFVPGTLAWELKTCNWDLELVTWDWENRLSCAVRHARRSEATIPFYKNGHFLQKVY